jgi:hypothetical protein
MQRRGEDEWAEAGGTQSLGKVVENPRLVHSPLAILNKQLCNIAAALIDETTRTHPTTQPTK